MCRTALKKPRRIVKNRRPISNADEDGNKKPKIFIEIFSQKYVIVVLKT